MAKKVVVKEEKVLKTTAFSVPDHLTLKFPDGAEVNYWCGEYQEKLVLDKVIGDTEALSSKKFFQVAHPNRVLAKHMLNALKKERQNQKNGFHQTTIEERADELATDLLASLALDNYIIVER